MKRSWTTLGLVVACVGVAYGCGDDDDNIGGAAGTAGTSGHGGTGGHSGSSGRATGGTSGRGTQTGGSSGRSAAGSSGNAEGGAAGHVAGGASGTSGGGSGNEGGSCDVNSTPRKLSSMCELVPVWEPDGTSEDTVTTNCSFESACESVKCGTLWSPYDANMCRRPLCRSSAECGAGERCIAPPLVGDFNCYFDPLAPFGTLAPFAVSADCTCGGFEESECAPRTYCVSAADYPPANDCLVANMTCDQLSYGYIAPFDWLAPLELPSDSDLAVALSDCEHAIQTAYRAACDGGHAGQGGAASQ